MIASPPAIYGHPIMNKADLIAKEPEYARIDHQLKEVMLAQTYIRNPPYEYYW